jgi:hypothetical protein
MCSPKLRALCLQTKLADLEPEKSADGRWPTQMTSMPATKRLFHPAIAQVSRAVLTYVVPSLAVILARRIFRSPARPGMAMHQSPSRRITSAFETS